MRTLCVRVDYGMETTTFARTQMQCETAQRSICVAGCLLVGPCVCVCWFTRTRRCLLVRYLTFRRSPKRPNDSHHRRVGRLPKRDGTRVSRTHAHTHTVARECRRSIHTFEGATHIWLGRSDSRIRYDKDEFRRSLQRTRTTKKVCKWLRIKTSPLRHRQTWHAHRRTHTLIAR